MCQTKSISNVGTKRECDAELRRSRKLIGTSDTIARRRWIIHTYDIVQMHVRAPFDQLDRRRSQDLSKTCYASSSRMLLDGGGPDEIHRIDVITPIGHEYSGDAEQGDVSRLCSTTKVTRTGVQLVPKLS